MSPFSSLSGQTLLLLRHNGRSALDALVCRVMLHLPRHLSPAKRLQNGASIAGLFGTGGSADGEWPCHCMPCRSRCASQAPWSVGLSGLNYSREHMSEAIGGDRLDEILQWAAETRGRR